MYINIRNDSSRYGAYLGFKLSRLEWIWGSTFEAVQKEFEPSMYEVGEILFAWICTKSFLKKGRQSN